MKHVGGGHEVGALQLHKQTGCSHTFRHECICGQFSLQLGWSHFDSQSLELLALCGHITAQCGWSHSIAHSDRLMLWQRVSHFGASHVGVHSSLHCVSAHFQLHCGAQAGECTSSAPDRTLRRLGLSTGG
mmetsp:Transcript_61947/g.164628  ORF Transcript_61947/g.164628 Transcript_61947/m.164628 type:complete len:130 (+) Transcript_61947:633-1022(+)